MKKLFILLGLLGICGCSHGWARSEKLATDEKDMYLVICTKDAALCKLNANEVCAKTYNPPRTPTLIGRDYYEKQDAYFFEYVCGGDDI